MNEEEKDYIKFDNMALNLWEILNNHNIKIYDHKLLAAICRFIYEISHDKIE